MAQLFSSCTRAVAARMAAKAGVQSVRTGVSSAADRQARFASTRAQAKVPVRTLSLGC